MKMVLLTAIGLKSLVVKNKARHFSVTKCLPTCVQANSTE